MWRHASHLNLTAKSMFLSPSSAGAGAVKSSSALLFLSRRPPRRFPLAPLSPVRLCKCSYITLRSSAPRFRSAIRCFFSSFPQSPMVDSHDSVPLPSGFPSDSDNVDPSRPAIPVRAFFFSTSVDLKGLLDQNKQNLLPPSSRMTNYVVLKFGDLRIMPNGLPPTLSGSDCSYIVVFHYGSIVLFNVPDHKVDGYLQVVEKHASSLLPEMRKDEYEVRENPALGSWMEAGLDHIMLQHLSIDGIRTIGSVLEYEVRENPALGSWMEAGLDHIMLQHLSIDGIRTIGSVLGQSIALDYYVRQVDGMVAEFTDINRAMEKTGTFTMERKKLFQLVGKANSNLADVILKLGLFERSDIAWKDAKYAQIWEYLRDEFELTQRFASLDFKLKFVEHNIRFLQEILQNRRSDFLEWLIIILIGAEILISLYDIAHRTSITGL